MNNTVLFIIDPQNDFCNPQGSLYVPDAEEDIRRIVELIDTHGDMIDEVILTADDHLPNDIAHPDFWTNNNGKHPEPFTPISLEDIRSGLFTTTAPEDLDIATKYIEQLEADLKTHTIWPQHCIAGTWGANIDEGLLDKLIEWTQGTSKHYQIVRKGWYPYTEHFGAFEAEVSYPMVESTLFNTPLARELNRFSQILIAGEAKSHCVNNTVRQMVEKAPELVQKLAILIDAMSPVKGCDHLSDITFQKAEELGAKIATTKMIF